MIDKKFLKESIDFTLMVVFFYIGSGIGFISLMSLLDNNIGSGLFIGIISLISYGIAGYYYLKK